MNSGQIFRNTLIILGTLAAAYVLLLSSRIIVVLLVAIIIASAIRPLVVRLVQWRLPTGAAILLMYLLIAVSIIGLMVLVLPPVFNQLANYLENDSLLAARIVNAQTWIERNLTTIFGSPVTLIAPEDLRAATSDFVRGIRNTFPTVVGSLGGTVAEAVLVIVMGVYWLTSRDKAVDFLVNLFVRVRREQVKEIVNEIETSMGSYVRGVTLVATFVGFANFLILTLLRIPNAPTLGVIIGLSTLIPVAGGFIGGGLSTLLAALGSPLHGLIVFGTFVAVQQIETHYLTPRTMSRSVGVDPLLIIVAIFVGFTLYGVIGAIISVPVLGTIAVLMRRLVIEPRVANVSAYKVEQGAVLLEPDPAAAATDANGTPKKPADQPQLELPT